MSNTAARNPNDERPVGVGNMNAVTKKLALLQILVQTIAVDLGVDLTPDLTEFADFIQNGPDA